MDHSPDAIAWVTRQGEPVYANASLKALLGFDGCESAGEDDVLPAVITGAAWGDLFDEASRGAMHVPRCALRARDGSSVEVSLALSPLPAREGLALVCLSARPPAMTVEGQMLTEHRQSESELISLRHAIEHLADAAMMYDSTGRFLYVNEAACTSLGYTREELLRLRVMDVDTHVGEEHWEALYEQIPRYETLLIQSEHERKDGQRFAVEVAAIICDSDEGQRTFGFCVCRDVSERISAQAALRESEERFRVIADTSPIGLVISRVSDGEVTYTNDQANELLGLAGDATTTVGELLQRLHCEDGTREALLDAMSLQDGELSVRECDGEPLHLAVRTRTFELHGQAVMCWVLNDITQARELSRRLSHEATRDSLTGLLNRRAFESKLVHLIDETPVRECNSALCYLDLDQFKVINDTCGHHAGDELLRQLSQLLNGRVRSSDTLARLGGDEFALLLEDCALEDATRVSNGIRRAVEDHRFAWEDRVFNVGVSIGLVAIDQTTSSASLALQHADSACYAAKDRGRNRVHIYSPNDEDLQQLRGEMLWVGRINEALLHDRFVLWQQPIVRCDGQREGHHLEVLVRMLDDAGEAIPPGAFLPAAERYGLAPKIDGWVAREVFKTLEAHPEWAEGLSMVAVNLSGQSLGNAEFMASLLALFDEFNVPAGKICFEITETAAVTHLAHAAEFITALRQRGCHFALDDFGSGLSSFGYLRTLPVDFLKIDGQFVRDIVTDRVDHGMVRSINELGQLMGKQTIAEFVENEEILEALREIGVDFAQGYGIGRPVALDPVACVG
ncbi:MAG: EAL domain-containing protein [Pseudomonadota bacterium]